MIQHSRGEIRQAHVCGFPWLACQVRQPWCSRLNHNNNLRDCSMRWHSRDGIRQQHAFGFPALENQVRQPWYSRLNESNTAQDCSTRQHRRGKPLPKLACKFP